MMSGCLTHLQGSEETVRVIAMDRSFHVDCYKCEVSSDRVLENFFSCIDTSVVPCNSLVLNDLKGTLPEMNSYAGVIVASPCVWCLWWLALVFRCHYSTERVAHLLRRAFQKCGLSSAHGYNMILSILY